MLFVKLKSRPRKSKMKIDFGWVLKCRNSMELFEWFELYGSNSDMEALFDCLDSKELRGFGEGRDHCHSQKAGAYSVLIRLEAEKRQEAMTLSSIVDFATSLTLDPKLKCLQEFGYIYIQRIGSFMMPSDNYVEYGEKELAIFPQKTFTESDISIKRWSGGKHYYAKVANVDVVVDGEQKWSTYREAEKHAKKFLNDLRN